LIFPLKKGTLGAVIIARKSFGNISLPFLLLKERT